MILELSPNRKFHHLLDPKRGVRLACKWRESAFKCRLLDPKPGQLLPWAYPTVQQYMWGMVGPSGEDNVFATRDEAGLPRHPQIHPGSASIVIDCYLGPPKGRE